MTKESGPSGPNQVAYYATDERTESGEVILQLRFYKDGRCSHTKAVPASQLHETLDALRKQQFIVRRVQP
jgi:DNA-binding HxlR family transcriptional regulator